MAQTIPTLGVKAAIRSEMDRSKRLMYPDLLKRMTGKVGKVASISVKEE